MKNAVKPVAVKQSLFQKVTVAEKRSLSVCSYGHEKRGKTWFALSAPGPVAVISSDSGTENAVREWQRQGKEIYLFQHTLPPLGQKIEVYESAWDRLAEAVYEAITSAQFRSVVVDTATEVWELLRLARFGRLTQVMPHHYGPVNNEFRSLLNKAVASDKNTVWIHKVKKVYKTNKEGKDSWTGEWERSGFADFGYIIDVVIEHRIVEDDDSGKLDFGVKVIDSRFRPTEVCGRIFTGFEATFPALAMTLLPDTAIDAWED